jgi:hypothetical protein
MHTIKAKLSPRSTSSRDKDRLLLTCINGLQSAIQILWDAAGPASSGLPGLQAGLNGLFFILDVVKVDCPSSSASVLSNDQVENISE